MAYDDEDLAWIAEIGFRIRDARLMKGWTQPELAKETGLYEKSIWDYEKGKTAPFNQINSLAKALEVSPAWLLHGEEAAPTALAAVLKRLDDLEARLAALEGE